MIILKILLWILLGIIGLILLVLILPVKAEASYIGGKLKYKVKFSLIPILDSEGGGILGWLKRRKKKKKKSGRKKEPDEIAEEFADQLVEEEISSENSVAESTGSDVSPADSPTETAQDAVTDTAPVQAEADNNAAEDDDKPFAEQELVVPVEDEKSSKKEKKKKKKDEDEEEKDETEEGKSLTDKIEFLIDVWNSAKHPIRKIFKAFKFQDVYMDYIIADEDAYKCAIKYGRMSGIIYNGLATFSRIFTVRLRTIDIQPGFSLKKGRWDTAVKLRFSVGTIVIAGLWFLMTFVFRVFIPGKLKKRKARKMKASAAVQK